MCPPLTRRCSDEGVLADICRTHILPTVSSWPGCDVLLLASAARHFSCAPALNGALLALAAWYHARHSSTEADCSGEFFESASACCALAHDVIIAYDGDFTAFGAAGTLLSMFSRDRRTVHCVAQRRETIRLIIHSLDACVSDVSCACVLMAVLRDCCSLASDEDASQVFHEITTSPCISVLIAAVAQFNKVIAEGRSTGTQALRSKADLLLNASSGLILNLSLRASRLGVNDCLLGSGLLRLLSDSASFTTSSLSISSNCLTVIGRFFHSQSFRDALCCDAQHGANICKFLLAVFHEHTDPAPRLLTMVAVCSLLQSAVCSSTFFKAGGATLVFDAVKILPRMHKSFEKTSEASAVNAIFTFACASATSSFAHSPATWLAELHSSGHLRAQSLLLQTLANSSLESASAAALLVLLVIPHPSSSFVRPPACSSSFGTGPLFSSDHSYWVSPVSGSHLRSMREQMDVDRVMQAMRAVVAFCETDDLTAESSCINVHKITAAVRALVAKISAGGGSDIADPKTFKHFANVFSAIAGLLRHISYKLSFIASKVFQEKQRSFKQSEDFNGIEDEYSLLSKKADVVEQAIMQKVLKLRSQMKESDFPAHKAMLVISSEEATNVNPDDVLRQYGTGGSVALVHDGTRDGTSVKSVFLGFAASEQKPIPLLSTAPYFGDVPPNAAVEGSVAFYKRHKVLGATASVKVQSKSIDTELHSAAQDQEEAVSTISENHEVNAAAQDIINGLELHNLDSSIIFVLKHVTSMSSQVARPALNLVQSILQLDSEWNPEAFVGSSNALRGNVQLRNIIVKLLLLHHDDLSLARPCLVILCFLIQNLDATKPEAQVM